MIPRVMQQTPDQSYKSRLSTVDPRNLIAATELIDHFVNVFLEFKAVFKEDLVVIDNLGFMTEKYLYV